MIKPPDGSILHDWLTSMSVTEVPRSYQLAIGMATLGASLRRDVWFDQVKWKVYPNLSVLLVGPSGIGKDVVIDQMEETLLAIGSVPVLGGRTMEQIYQCLVELGDPACAVIPAHEISSFVGQKDYQKGMIQDLTDLLTTKAYKNVSIKGQPKARIMRPTVTIPAGSTPEWLHSAMPAGALDGGMFPRFLVVCEEYGTRQVPLIGWDNDCGEVRKAKVAGARFVERAKEIVAWAAGIGDVPLLSDARDVYHHWYCHRREYFSKAVAPYANRSRDQVLRMGLISAMSRGVRYIEECDVVFGIEVMADVAARIDRAVVAPTQEARAGDEIARMLPTDHKEVLAVLGRKYPVRVLKEAVGLLLGSGKMRVEGGRWIKGE